MNCSMPGLPVHHQLLESTQTHVHWVSDVIQSSHPLSSPSPPAVSPSIRVFSNVSAFRIRRPKYWSFNFSISPSNEYPGLVSFRIDCLGPFAVQGPLESSPTPQFKSINSSVLGFLHSPTLTSIHDYWKNHSLDYIDLFDKVTPLLFKMLSDNLPRLIAIVFSISLNYYQFIKLINLQLLKKKISHSFLCILASLFCKRSFCNVPFLAD